MSITVVTPADWNMTPPVERGRHLGMTIQTEDPFLRLLEAEPNSYTAPHSHNEPEIIVVLEGRLLFNGRWCEQGSVVHVPAGEDYWHSTGAERCIIALMRPKGRGQIRYAAEAVAAE